MLLPDDSTLAYIIVGLVAIANLPWFGQRVLAFLRDRDDYRASRPPSGKSSTHSAGQGRQGD